MNVAEDHEQPTRQTNFDFSLQGTHWSQVTPQYMPWGHTPASPAAPLVTFTAQANSVPQQPAKSQTMDSRAALSRPSTSGMFFKHDLIPRCKRKPQWDGAARAAKQHVTEERMAAHMSRLHISSETPQEVPLYPEEARSREQRLYMCEEMRRLQTESILPQSLLGRLERPCMAVMLWQPPPKIPELLPPSLVTARRPPLRQYNDDVDNNNSSTVDLNNMDMDT